MCERMLQFLMNDAGGAVDELSSFQLLETLLYRTQLSVFTGRVHNAQHLLQVRVPLSHTNTHTLKTHTKLNGMR